MSRHEGVLALRAAGARLPKRWPAASAVRPREGEVSFECVSALGVGSDGFHAEVTPENSGELFELCQRNGHVYGGT